MLPPADISVVLRMAELAASSGRTCDRAAAVLAPLHDVIAFRDAWIGLYRTELRTHVSTARSGSGEPTSRVHTSAVLAQLDGAGGSGREPVRFRAAPAPPSALGTHPDPPASGGRTDGVAVPLFRHDGSYVGVLALESDAPGCFGDAQVELLAALAPVVAAAVDPLRQLVTLAAVVEHATAGTALTRTGEPLAMPGLPRHPLLAPGSPLLPLALACSAAQPMSTFVHPYRDPCSADRLVRVTVLAAPPDVPDVLAAVLLLSRAADQQGLTRRELEVMGMLVDGWSNCAIAAALVVTERTVATHVEHILTKLCVTSRTSAAAAGLRLGLYIPHQVTTGAGRP